MKNQQNPIPHAISAPIKGPLPLVIGVTGHRDLREQDCAALEASVRAVFTELEELYPHSPLLLLSPLAEGADRLVARVALERGLSLMVPLPMARELYELDFETPASRAEFNQLLEQAQHQIELPCVEGNEGADIGVPGACRDQQYALVGALIARHCQILLALWDGLPSDRVGGTAQVIDFRLRGVPEPYVPKRDWLEEEEIGPVCHIVTPRAGTAQPSGTPFERREILPTAPLATEAHEEEEHAYQRIYERIEGFNRDAIEQEARLQSARAQSEAYFFPSPAEGDAPVEVNKLPASARSSLGRYVVADALSIYFANLTAKSTKFVFGAVLVAALCFNLFHSLSGSHGSSAADSEGHAANIAGNTVARANASRANPSRALHSNSSNSTLATSPQNTSPQNASPQAIQISSEVDSPQGAHPSVSSDSHAPAGIQKSGQAGQPAANAEKSAGAAVFLSNMLQGPWFLIVYLTIIAIIFLRHRHVEKNDYQNKHQDYRALAEGLRIQAFWRMAGIDDAVADHYLGEQRGELEWIRSALRTWNILAPRAAMSGEERIAGVHLVQQGWIEAQRNYFARKARQEHQILERSEGRIHLLLRLSFGLTVVLAFLLTLPYASGITVPSSLNTLSHLAEQWHSHIMIVILMLAVGAGLTHGYTEQKAYSEHARQFGRMSVMFDIAQRRLQSLLIEQRFDEAENLILELGKQALAENGNWVLLHRERPLEVPQAG